MSAKAHAGPVGGLRGIREGLALFSEGVGKFIREMRMTAAVAAALVKLRCVFLPRS
jgi:hypothetical protein